MKLSLRLLGAGLCAVPLVAAPAQTSKAGEAPADQKPVKETVSVSAKKMAVQVLPDRTVYNLDTDIQSATSSLSDVLRNLPSVDVDIEGNLSLRGDTNVIVLVDGKKSPLLSGNLAEALQQIPASMVERIEIITNPPAEFRAEGSAGVINIVLKPFVLNPQVLKTPTALAASGSLRVNKGNQGRINGTASGNFTIGKVNLSASYTERKDENKFNSSGTRSGGATSSLSFDLATKMGYSSRFAMLFANYLADEANSFMLSSTYNRFGMHFDMAQRMSWLAGETVTNSLSRSQNESVSATLDYTHAFATKGEQFRLYLSRSSTWGRNSYDSTGFNAADVADYWQSQYGTSRENLIELKADYILPIGESDLFKTGYALQNQHNLADNHGLLRDTTMADWIADSGNTSLFVLDRTVHAGYLSYEWKFGKFGVVGGLRVEHDIVETDLKTTGEVHDSTTTGLYPSLHLSYAITDTQKLKLSYTRRMNRPGIYALNPVRHSSNAFNVWGGNPDLKPEQTDSFETSYHYIGEKTDFVTTGYYRTTYKVINNVYRNLSDTVLLATWDNVARRMASGIEANLNATLLSGLTFKTSATLSYNEFNPGASALGTKQSGLGWNIKGGISWQATPDDLVQFNAGYTGKQIFAQGYTKPVLNGDFGFKHNFGSQLAGVLSINNLFDSASRDSVLDAPGVRQTSHFSMPGRIFYIGLVYTFGGFKDNEPLQGGGYEGMDVGGPPGGGPG
jgi:outer membrane receptor protein involved in Fe transport